MTETARSHGRKALRASRTPRQLMGDRPDLQGAWKARVVTLLPGSFPGLLGESVIGKALDQGLWQLETIDIRPYGEGKHQNVDDTPSGGGAGMVLRADIVGKALTFAAKGTPADRADWPVIYLSPRGKPLSQPMVEDFAKTKGITLLCGRFEGVDERVLEEFSVQEISLGDFVLTGGEIAAQALIDATVRLLPNVLGNTASSEEESFSDFLLEHPQYTKPATWQGRDIPQVLLSGHHGHIADWRRQMAEKLTKQRRPDLWRAYCKKYNRDPEDNRQ
ncbi:MAG: tRNA (guanosine(37)-N1)-methyltransferase TrmD [Paracoccaceae bacterium]